MREGRIFVETISTRRLPRSDWFEFMRKFVEDVNLTSPEKLGFVPLFSKLKELFDECDKIMRPVRKSALTPELVLLDKKRTKMWRQMKKIVSGYLKNYDERKDEAARKLIIIFETFRFLPKEDVAGKTADISLAIEDFRTKLFVELQTLNLTQWVNELEKTNNEFEDVFILRIEEKVENSPSVKFTNLAPKINHLYDVFMWNLEYKMLDEPSADVQRFVSQWNGIILSFKTLQAQRSGRKAGKILNF